MLTYGITEIQTKPSLIKEMMLGEIIDKRAHKRLGYFISSKYEKYIANALEAIERDEKIAKLKTLKKHQDLEFCEAGVDDGL
jgi:hypothetical protein